MMTMMIMPMMNISWALLILPLLFLFMFKHKEVSPTPATDDASVMITNDNADNKDNTTAKPKTSLSCPWYNNQFIATQREAPIQYPS